MFILLPERLSDLFPKFSVATIIIKMPGGVVLRHLPKYYDHNIQREYHSSEIWNYVNNCWPLKRRVLELIKNGLLISRIPCLIRIHQ